MSKKKTATQQNQISPSKRAIKPAKNAVVSSNAKLNLQQEKFVLEYSKNPNATIAAIKAGYSKNSAASQGQRLLNNAKVKAALQGKRQKLAEKAERNALDVFNDIVAVTNAATKKKDYKNALKGLELQGKHLGMFTDKVESTVSVKAEVHVFRLPDNGRESSGAGDA